MKKIFIISLAASILVPACADKEEEDPTKDLIGYWVLASETWTEQVNGTIVDSGSDTYSTDDPYAFDEMIRFTADSIYSCENDVMSSEYFCENEGSYTIDGDNLLITEGGEDEIIPFSISGDKLNISFDETYTDGDSTYTYHSELEFLRYTAGFPPAEWTTALPNDSYEPDDSPATATAITVGANAQDHVLYPDDKDWFSFPAQAGTAYIIETTGNIDTWLTLNSTDGSTFLADDDDSGANINARIGWTCTTAGTYFFEVRGFDTAEAGIYSVSVVTGTSASASHKTSRKAAKTVHHTFIRR